MQTTVDLEPEALRKAELIAFEQGQTVSEVLSAVLLSHHAEHREDGRILRQGPTELPGIRLGRPSSLEEIRAMIDEDEEWEITRGNPYHPWYLVDPDRTVFSEGYPRVVDGPLGLPEVQLGPPKPRTLEVA